MPSPLRVETGQVWHTKTGYRAEIGQRCAVHPWWEVIIFYPYGLPQIEIMTEVEIQNTCIPHSYLERLAVGQAWLLKPEHIKPKAPQNCWFNEPLECKILDLLPEGNADYSGALVLCDIRYLADNAPYQVDEKTGAGVPQTILLYEIMQAEVMPGPFIDPGPDPSILLQGP